MRRFAHQNGSFPSAYFARYSYSTLESGQLVVNISRKDPYYRPWDARNRSTDAYARYQPSFLCSVCCFTPVFSPATPLARLRGRMLTRMTRQRGHCLRPCCTKLALCFETST
jgi:hypothetical protein